MRNVHMLGVSALALAIAAPAYAQTTQADSNSIAEIVVTATKREQTLQDVPISVAVTGQQTIERAQVRDLIDLQSVVPSLKVQQFNAAGQTNFVIRGFGNGNGNDGIESSVGIFIDGVYRSRSAAALDDLPEIERVEVLRGPQSTLFGKNVSAGAISIVTKKPQYEFGGKVEGTYGNYNTRQIKGTITGPRSETLAVRLASALDAGIDGVTLAAQTLTVLPTGHAMLLRAGDSAVRCMLVGGDALLQRRHIWWNFVSTRKERIVQAADDWEAQRMGHVPGETESIPLPERRFKP